MIAPLANLLAVQENDPDRRLQLKASLAATAQFDRIDCRDSGWVVAQKYLPDSQPDGPEVAAAGFYFSEGRDEWEASALCRPEDWRKLGAQLEADPAALSPLPGDFTFIHFGREQATAARSVAGRIPLYWWKTRNRWAIATCFDYAALAPVLPDDRSPDLMSCLIWAHGGYYFVDGRTPLNAVRCAPAATYLRFDRQGVQLPRRYWTPPRLARRLPTPEQERRTLHEFRERFLREMGRQLHPGKPNMVSLSGGVDSSALAYILHRQFKAKLWTISYLLKVPESRQRELSYIRPVLKDCGVAKALMTTLDETWLLKSIQRPSRSLLPHFSSTLDLVQRLPAGSRPATLFDGGFADEICGSVRTYPDWTRSLRFWQMLALWRRWPGGWKAPARWFKHRLQDLWQVPNFGQHYLIHDLVPAAMRLEYGAAHRLAWRRAVAECPERPYLRMCWEFNAAGHQWTWNALSRIGVRPVLPFQCRSLIELAMSTHPALQVGPGIKRLLRESFADVVPALSLFRPDKGHIAVEWSLPSDHPVGEGRWWPGTVRYVPSAVNNFERLDVPAKRALLALDCIFRSLEGTLARRP